MQTGLADATVLITGAAGGIGQATARAFAEEGARLVLHANNSLAAAEELAGDLPTEAVAVRADLATEHQADRAFAEALEHFERIDHIVVNAGIWVPEHVPLQEMTLDQWRRTIDIDLTGAFLTCRAFLRHLAKDPRDDASIVLVGSTAGLFGEAGHADYSAAKAGLVHGLTPSLKNEIVALAPRGRVNSVCPGWVLTPMAEQALNSPDALSRETQTVAMNKVARPEDVAHAIVYLTSPALSGHVSGAALPVHGGMEGRVLHR